MSTLTIRLDPNLEKGTGEAGQGPTPLKERPGAIERTTFDVRACPLCR